MICPFCGERIDNLTYKESGETYYTIYQDEKGILREDISSYPEGTECLFPCCEGGLEGIEKEDVEAMVTGEALLVPEEALKDKIIEFRGTRLYVVKFNNQLYLTPVGKVPVYGRSEYNDWFNFHVLYLAGKYRFLWPRCLHEMTQLDIKRLLTIAKEITEEDLRVGIGQPPAP